VETAAEKTSPIVVGIDGSDDSRRALLWAAHEARLRGAPIHAITAWEPFVGAWASPAGAFPAAVWNHSDQVKDVATRTERFVEDVIGETNVSVQSSAVIGNPAATLMEIAQREAAGLLVVGCRGRGGFRRLMLGSVSEQCATHAEVPVVIVRPGTEIPGEAGATDPAE